LTVSEPEVADWIAVRPEARAVTLLVFSVMLKLVVQVKLLFWITVALTVASMPLLYMRPTFIGGPGELTVGIPADGDCGTLRMSPLTLL